MAGFNFENVIEGKNLSIEAVPADKEKWKTLQAQSFVPDKDKFILEAYNKAFPNNKLDDVTILYSLASRSSIVGEWLAKQQVKFIDELKTPKYLEGVVDKDTVSKSEKDIVAYNQTLSDESKEIEKAARNFDAKVAEIRKKYKDSRDKLTENPVMKVLTLRQNYLPLSLLIAIENYSPKDADAPSQKAYAKELLVNYQRALLSLMKEDKEIDISKVIEDLRVK